MNIKRFFALLLVVAAVTAFAACDGESKPTGTQGSNESNLESESISSESTSDTQQSTESETQAPVDTTDEDLVDYKLVEQSGVHYIAFNNVSDYNDEESNELASLEFGSLAEFKNTVTTGKLANWQKTVIATAFKKDEVGRILTCDFDSLLEPRMPNDCRVDGVSWSGELYAFYVSTSSEVFGFIHNYTNSQYNDIYNEDFENRFNSSTITVREILNTDDGKTVTTYTTFAGKLMNIRYTYVSGQKTITVDETYRLSMVDETLATSSTVPFNVTLYCSEPGANYVVDLFGFVEKPSDTWFYEFGMKPYVDLDTVVD